LSYIRSKFTYCCCLSCCRRVWLLEASD